MNFDLWSALDFDLNYYVTIGIKVVAAIGAAFVGWLAGGPISGMLSRLAFHRSPGLIGTWLGRMVTAGIAGCLAFMLVNLGMGGGLGFGFGTGTGGGPGLGPGPGPGPKGEVVQAEESNPKVQPGVKPAPKPAREVVQIELVGGEKFEGGGKYYLINRAGAAKTINEVREYFDKNKERLEVQIVLTPDSVAQNHPAVRVLRTLSQDYEFPTVVLAQ